MFAWSAPGLRDARRSSRIWIVNARVRADGLGHRWGVRLASADRVMAAHRIVTLAVALALSACEPAYDYVPVTDAYVASGGGAEPNQVSAEVTPRSGRAA